MNKFVLLFLILCFAGCVDSSISLDYAQRSNPECSDFVVRSHSYSGDSNSDSLTEVSMRCQETRKSITIKCRHGFGFVSDTVCYVNN